jgi:large subunit ribosomal protein L25
MEQLELRATTRDILGKKVRFLRRQGITPVHLFGPDVESMALQCDTAELQRILAQAGRTKLVGLRLDEANMLKSVLVREVQKDARTGDLIHVDFYQVRMAEAVRVDVPIVLVGEAPALRAKENMLAQELNSLTIECLPDQIPSSLELDMGSLAEAEQAIRVKDIELAEGVVALQDPEQIVVKITARPAEIVEEVVVEEEVAAPKVPPLPEEELKEE